MKTGAGKFIQAANLGIGRMMQHAAGGYQNIGLIVLTIPAFKLPRLAVVVARDDFAAQAQVPA